MAEEFEESEVIFQQNVQDMSNDVCNFSDLNSIESRNYYNELKRKKTKTDNNSAPVSIPQNAPRNSWLRYRDQDLDGGDGEFVPPHVIVGRRLAGKMMAFSVCTGNGRTLKGRDLSEVRNSVLRMTGFLET